MSNANTGNISRVLRIVWMNPGISRVEIARKLALDKSTITNIVSRLMQQNLVISLNEGAASPQGGRKPIGLSINNRFGIILGLEITTDKVHAVGIDLHGVTQFMKKITLERNHNDLDTVFIKAFKEVGEEISSTGMPLIGIGIGVSGLVNPVTGEIIQSNPLDIYSPYPLLEKISSHVEVPISIDNDANCCCWEEMICSGRDRYQNFIFVLAEDRFHNIKKDSRRMGFAVGFGLVVHGKVVRGADFSAGEFQSVFWKPENASQFSISDDIMAEPEKYPESINETIQELAANTAFLVNSLDVSRVVLGGGIEKYGSRTIETFRKEIEKNWSYAHQVNCEICMVHNGDFAVAAGAAAMYLEKLFSLPALHVEGSDAESSEMSGYDLFQSLMENL